MIALLNIPAKSNFFSIFKLTKKYRSFEVQQHLLILPLLGNTFDMSYLKTFMKVKKEKKEANVAAANLDKLLLALEER